MNILITGSSGFIGKNLVATLASIIEKKNKAYTLEENTQLFLYDVDSDLNLLDLYTQSCDFVFHLAGVNRPQDEKEFIKGNFGFTSTLLDSLKKHNNKAPILITSSIQAELDNPYGKSKRAGKNSCLAMPKEHNSKAYIYRLPNVFGKWCRPNYNSAVATFCYNIARDLPVTINDPEVIMNLVYIDDVVDSFIKAIKGDLLTEDKFCKVPTVHTIKLGKIVKLLTSFKKMRSNLSVPNLANSFEKVLYSTYLSYLPGDQFSYPLKMNADERGSFTEIIRTVDRGQFSVNVSKSGITKGNHWHHTKNEKFLVVSGVGVIRCRNINSKEIIEYHVSGEEMEVVDIPPGYTHSIENLGETDMVTFMWANETFNPNAPDTFYEEV